MASTNRDGRIHHTVVILGAGPAGLGAALELRRSRKAIVCIERDPQVGGLSKTLRYGQFRVDIGPHRFYTQNKYLYELIEGLLGDKWLRVDRLTRFYINRRFLLYPVELKDALRNVGPRKGLRIIRDYFWERTKKMLSNRTPVSVEEELVTNFGRTLAELNMLNYTEKVWGLPASEISPDWTRQRIRGLSLKEVAMNVVRTKTDRPKTLVDQFYYPSTGAGLIYEKIGEKISSGSGIIELNSCPIRVKHNGKQIQEIVANINGESRVFFPEHVISSIPLTGFIRLLDPPAPAEILKASECLKFRSHVSLFITLNKESVFPDQWIYFPEKDIPFGRVTEPKNFSKLMSPPGKTSLLVEFFCWENDETWNASKEELSDISVGWLESNDFIRTTDVMKTYLHKQKYAYPVYHLGYKKPLDQVKKYLKQFDNLQLVGRSGIFRYNNQDHALEMGILAARNIIGKEQYDVESVGMEEDYFERGITA